MLDQGAFKDPVLVAEDDESGGDAAQEGGSEDSFGVSECAEEESGTEEEDVVYECMVATLEIQKGVFYIIGSRIWIRDDIVVVCMKMRSRKCYIKAKKTPVL